MEAETLRRFGVFDGARAQSVDGVAVFPWREFVRELTCGSIVG